MQSILYQQTQNLLLAIRKSARSDTKVVLVGYPYMANDDSFVLTTYKMTWLGIRQVKYEVSKKIRQLGRDLDTLQQNVVNQVNSDANTDFVTFVNTKDLFRGHEVDPKMLQANPNAWVADFGDGLLLKGEYFHLNAVGHQQLGTYLCNTFGSFDAGME